MLTSISKFVTHRVAALGGIAVVGVITILAGCQTADSTKAATAPTLYIVKWDQDSQGGQGPETTIQPGGRFSVGNAFLGSSKADIRVYGAGKEGVRQLTVSGSASGHCSTAENSSGPAFKSPSALVASFPTQTVTATAGEVVDGSIRIHLDALLVTPSCGLHQFENMPEPMEFYLDLPATWEITARADNCCGVAASANFTIVVE